MNFLKYVAKLLGMKPANYPDPIEMAQLNTDILWWDFDRTWFGWDGKPVEADIFLPNGKTKKIRVIDFVKAAAKDGYHIGIYSCRLNPGPMRDVWCAEMLALIEHHKIPVDMIWGMRRKDGIWVYQSEEAVKPLGAAIVDDCTFRPDGAGLVALTQWLKNKEKPAIIELMAARSEK